MYHYMRPYTVREKRERQAAERVARLRRSQRIRSLFYYGSAVLCAVGIAVWILL